MNNDVNELKNEEKGSKQGNSNVPMAIVFIAVGVVLIISNVSGFEFDNWWVLFMLVPAALFVKNIYDDYRVNGRLTARSTGAIIATLAILATAATFLFEAITWGMIWPIGLIFAGIAIFLGNRS
jgi:hypothetical protein